MTTNNKQEAMLANVPFTRIYPAMAVLSKAHEKMGRLEQEHRSSTTHGSEMRAIEKFDAMKRTADEVVAQLDAIIDAAQKQKEIVALDLEFATMERTNMVRTRRATTLASKKYLADVEWLEYIDLSRRVALCALTINSLADRYAALAPMVGNAIRHTESEMETILHTFELVFGEFEEERAHRQRRGVTDEQLSEINVDLVRTTRALKECIDTGKVHSPDLMDFTRTIN